METIIYNVAKSQLSPKLKSIINKESLRSFLWVFKGMGRIVSKFSW